MSRRRDERTRVLGPHQLGDGRWRIVVVDPQAAEPRHRRLARHYAREAEAVAAKRLIERRWAKLEALTIDEAIGDYQEFLERKGTKPLSFKETGRRLRLF